MPTKKQLEQQPEERSNVEPQQQRSDEPEQQPRFPH